MLGGLGLTDCARHSELSSDLSVELLDWVLRWATHRGLFEMLEL